MGNAPGAGVGAAGAPGSIGVLQTPGQQAAAAPSALDLRLCLTNIPSTVSEDRIRELPGTFGSLKYFTVAEKNKDAASDGPNVAFFEFHDSMTQQQAKASLE